MVAALTTAKVLNEIQTEAPASPASINAPSRFCNHDVIFGASHAGASDKVTRLQTITNLARHLH
jgi:hypothetical protein